MAVRANRERISADAVVAPRQLASVRGGVCDVPDDEHLVHLQFRRFAGCPVCNLHLRSVARRHEEIVAAGVREVVVFHSPPEELRPHVADLPFAVVADPDKRLYAEFGVESSPRALLDPRAWSAIARGIFHSLLAILGGRELPPSANPRGGRLGLPADFLIASTGQVLACKYGTHADDQWSVDELLSLAAAVSGRAAAACPPDEPTAARRDRAPGIPESSARSGAFRPSRS